MRKLECALEARQTPLVIIARTDASSIEEGILRAKQFHAAGADLTLIDGLPSIDALKRVAQEVPGPKVINLIHGGRTPLLPSAQLHELGFKIVLYSTPALYIAASAMVKAMTLLNQTGDLGSISDQSTSFREFQQFIEGQYLLRPGGERLAGRAVGGERPLEIASPGRLITESA
jgi:2-methylisocitrate lyase-like PEP mutase family enzyme